jgi:hypothetical protein
MTHFDIGLGVPSKRKNEKTKGIEDSTETSMYPGGLTMKAQSERLKTRSKQSKLLDQLRRVIRMKHYAYHR